MRFVILSDSKGKNHGINERILKKILNRTSKLNPLPEFIVFGGDSVAGGPSAEILTSQLERLKKLIREFHSNILIIPAAGNHEVINQDKDDRYEKILSAVYQDFVPDSVLENYNKTVYYKDFDDTRLIVLSPFHCNSIHRIENDQLEWLEKAASADIKNKIVFVHSPAFPTGAHLGRCLDSYPAGRDCFWKIIDKCNVNIVFSGHEHNYSRRIIDSSFNNGGNGFKASVCQVITGGGGEKLKDTYKDKEGVVVPPIGEYHFVIVDIVTEGIFVSAISAEGKKLDGFKILK
jgi:hypothetical protein